MNTDTEIWQGFVSTFGMLFVVLAFFLGAFYLFRKLSGGIGGKRSGDLIRVLSVHHLSPKEKLVLVQVHTETLLIGVTPSRISKLTDIDDDSDFLAQADKSSMGFSEILGRSLKNRSGVFTPPDVNQEKRSGRHDNG